MLSAGTPCTVASPDWILALCYVETDKLLDAFLILLLSGAADWILTWLSEGTLRLPHLLVHPGQTQPERKKEGMLKKVIKAGE